jgi:predicted RNA binding protein YcfA (HicA-like mRNA interferase family)
MTRLPNVSARDAIRAFVKAGFTISRQKGSHVRLQHASGLKLIIPNHPGDLKRPLLKALIKQANLSEAEFRSAFVALWANVASSAAHRTSCACRDQPQPVELVNFFEFWRAGSR